MRTTCEAVARAYLGEPVKRQGRELFWRCPRHDDHDPSLMVNSRKNCWFCGPCGPGGNWWELAAFLSGRNTDDRQAIVADLQKHGLLTGHERVAETYPYRDEEGQLLFEMERLEPRGFRVRRPNGHGGWISNLKGVRRVLYRLPEIKNATLVFLVEGEKDANALVAIGLESTTNPLGAGKWLSDYNPSLAGKHVVIIPDADEAGERHALEVARELRPLAASVRMLRLPGLAEGGDVSDWLQAGGTSERLLEFLANVCADEAGELDSATPIDLKVRDFRQKDLFRVDDRYLDGYAQLLGPTVTVVYLSLCRRANRSQVCFPSQRRIGAEHGLTERTVRGCLCRLEKAKLIRISRTRGPQGRWLHNEYVLLDKSEWLSPEEICSAGLSRGNRTSGSQTPTKELSNKEENNLIGL